MSFVGFRESDGHSLTSAGIIQEGLPEFYRTLAGILMSAKMASNDHYEMEKHDFNDPRNQRWIHERFMQTLHPKDSLKVYEISFKAHPGQPVECIYKPIGTIVHDPAIKKARWV